MTSDFLTFPCSNVDEVEQRLTANSSTGTSVTITSYTSSMYTFPSDGYTKISHDGALITFCFLCIYSSNDKEIARIGSTGGPDNLYSTDYKSVFVKKGMKAKFYRSTSSGIQAYFTPISN